MFQTVYGWCAFAIGFSNCCIHFFLLLSFAFSRSKIFGGGCYYFPTFFFFFFFLCVKVLPIVRTDHSAIHSLQRNQKHSSCRVQKLFICSISRAFTVVKPMPMGYRSFFFSFEFVVSDRKFSVTNDNGKMKVPPLFLPQTKIILIFRNEKKRRIITMQT